MYWLMHVTYLLWTIDAHHEKHHWVKCLDCNQTIIYQYFWKMQHFSLLHSTSSAFLCIPLLQLCQARTGHALKCFYYQKHGNRPTHRRFSWLPINCKSHSLPLSHVLYNILPSCAPSTGTGTTCSPHIHTIVRSHWVEHQLNAYNSPSRLGLLTKPGALPGIYDAWKIPKAQDYKPQVR